MRNTFKRQFEFGTTPIESIQFDIHSRDDIPKILRGLQSIYVNDNIRDQVFSILETNIKKDVSFSKGRPGMDLWVLLVLGVLRLGMNCDYDRLNELANEHHSVRQMLGYGEWTNHHQYRLQTIKDNVGLLTEDILQAINTVVVKHGHSLIDSSQPDTLNARCDSSVVETHVEYPTDTGMLFDAMRKTIRLTARLCNEHGMKGLRQGEHNISRIKTEWRKVQYSNRCKKADAEQIKKAAHQCYLNTCTKYLNASLLSIKALHRVADTLTDKNDCAAIGSEIAKTQGFQAHASRLIDQIDRRVLQDKKIPSEEKIYSIFQEHTEWISKGKAGVPVELGIKVCIVEDQYQFILHHRVMKNEQDVDVAVKIVNDTKAKFSNLSSCSFDKGFYSKSNQMDLAKTINTITLPKKGKLSAEDKAKEHTEGFKQARRQHSAVESAINALEHHGFDRCPDHGVEGFKSYVGLSVLARNIQQVGVIALGKQKMSLKRKQKNHKEKITA